MATEAVVPDRNFLVEEALRIESLQRLLVLDTTPEHCFDEIAELAATMFAAPDAMMTLVDETRTWVKASVSGENKVLPRDVSLCSLVIQQDGCLVVLDTRSDPRVSGTKLLCARESPRFYAGAPLITRDGQRVGVLCVVDPEPRQFFGWEEQKKLVTLASLASDRLELRSLQNQAADCSRMTNGADGTRILGERLLSLVPEIQPALQERTRLKNELQKAIQLGQMELHYQPEVDLNTRTIVGFEALVRWRHPERGLVSPGDFIPLAEETGLILPLGDWSLREACRQVLEWRAATANRLDLRVSVNLSAAQFTRPNLLENVAAILEETGLDPESLRIEVTESSLMSSADTVLATMRGLRDLGVGLHMDDFGTGYSSLHHLHCFPFDTLKIDRSFIARLGDERDAMQIVRTIIDLGRTLNMGIVAEGIEMEKQAESLQKMGCNYGQGYYFSRPLQSSAVATLLKRYIAQPPVSGELRFGANPHPGSLKAFLPAVALN